MSRFKFKENGIEEQIKVFGLIFVSVCVLMALAFVGMSIYANVQAEAFTNANIEYFESAYISGLKFQVSELESQVKDINQDLQVCKTELKYLGFIYSQNKKKRGD